MKRHTNYCLQLTESTLLLEERSHTLKMERIHGNRFASVYELYALIEEEVDEFWDSVKAKDPDPKELLDILAVGRSGVFWLYSRLGLQFVEEFHVRREVLDDVAQVSIAGEHELYARIKERLQKFWEAVVEGLDNNRLPNPYKLMELLMIVRAGLLWLCEKARAEVQARQG